MKLYTTASLALLCALVFSMSAQPAAAASDPVNWFELRQEAERAYNDRDAKKAQFLYLQLTEEFPADPEAWYGLSRAYEWGEEFDKSIDAAKRVQDLGYFSAAYLSHRLAKLNMSAGNSDESLRWLARAMQEGYSDRPSLKSDEAFASLQQNPEFMSLAGIPASQISDRNAGLRFDIDYLVEEAQRMHAGLSQPSFSQEFAAAAKKLRDDVPAMTDAQVLAGMMRLLAILSDGHTGIYGPDPDTPLDINPAQLPLKFYEFDEGTYITDGIGEAAQFAGSRVLKFGDHSAEETLQRMTAYRGVDNPMTWNWMVPQFYLGRISMLQQVGATKLAESVTLTLQDATGKVSEHTIDGGDFNFPRKLRPSPAAQGDLPLYLTNIDSNYWLHSFASQSAVYFQFNQVRNSDEQSITEFAKELAERLENEESKNLIIDVRHNNGGNNTLVSPLIKTLVVFENAAPGRQIYVITGRNTFSAAQNFINRVERWTGAIFVGEPSSSSPNFVGESTTLLLPYSRIRGSISNRFWQDSDPGDLRAWITPTVPVKPTAAAYFANEDAALAAVFEIIGLDRQN